MFNKVLVAMKFHGSGERPLIISLGSTSQKMLQARFHLPHQVANASWFNVIEAPTETVI